VIGQTKVVSFCSFTSSVCLRIGIDKTPTTPPKANFPSSYFSLQDIVRPVGGQHTRRELGARAMDIFTTLVQTSRKVGLSTYAYLRDHLRSAYHLPSLSQALT